MVEVKPCEVMRSTSRVTSIHKDYIMRMPNTRTGFQLSFDRSTPNLRHDVIGNMIVTDPA